MQNGGFPVATAQQAAEVAQRLRGLSEGVDPGASPGDPASADASEVEAAWKARCQADKRVLHPIAVIPPDVEDGVDAIVSLQWE